MATIDIQFSKPKYSAPVKGDKTVGVVGRAEATYCCEASYGDVSAYAEAETPAKARSEAARRLYRKLAMGA